MSVGPETPIPPTRPGCFECGGGDDPRSVCPSCETQIAALTDLTADWIAAQESEEPHKGGWLVGDCWVDRHGYYAHAATCTDCRTTAQRERTTDD